MFSRYVPTNGAQYKGVLCNWNRFRDLDLASVFIIFDITISTGYINKFISARIKAWTHAQLKLRLWSRRLAIWATRLWLDYISLIMIISKYCCCTTYFFSCDLEWTSEISQLFNKSKHHCALLHQPVLLNSQVCPIVLLHAWLLAHVLLRLVIMWVGQTIKLLFWYFLYRELEYRTTCSN